MSTSLRTLKGVGEKTEKLFAKIGVTDMESLLSYYPRNYDAYEEPVEIRSLEEGAVVAISVAVITGVYVNQVRNLQVITTTVADLTGKISVTWFNAPYLRSAVRKGSRFVLRGRVVRKQGKLQMEHPEIFTPAALLILKIPSSLLTKSRSLPKFITVSGSLHVTLKPISSSQEATLDGFMIQNSVIPAAMSPNSPSIRFLLRSF